MNNIKTLIEALRIAATAATPGPWVAKTAMIGRPGEAAVKEPGSFDWVCSMQVSNQINWDKDAHFVATANPAAVLELLDYISALEGAPAGVRAAKTLEPGNAELVAALQEVCDIMEKAKKLLKVAGFAMEGGTISGPYTAAMDKARSLLEGQRPAAANAGSQRPVAWIVYAKYDGKMVPQYPAHLSPEKAEEHRAMFTEESIAKVRELFDRPAVADAASIARLDAFMEAEKISTGKFTDLSARLRETADQQPGWKPLLTAAADEIERYYGGMLNWKAAAQQKDECIADLRIATVAAARDVLAERRRQMSVEGWPPEHDDEHAEGQMAVAAGYYALASGYPHERDLGAGHRPQYWPWAPEWWKPKGARRNLVRAAALIIAEIERIDRAAANGAGVTS